MRRVLHVVRRWVVREARRWVLSRHNHHRILLLVVSERLNIGDLLKWHLTLVDDWHRMLTIIGVYLILMLRHIDHLLRLNLTINGWLVLAAGIVQLRVLVLV